MLKTSAAKIVYSLNKRFFDAATKPTKPADIIGRNFFELKQFRLKKNWS